jgi:predicted nucleic acid-binding protein
VREHRARRAHQAQGGNRAAAAGLLATCPITELEFFFSARSLADRERAAEDLRALFGWVPVDDRAYERASQVQELLTGRGEHRSAGAVDLVVAATAELQGLTLLHRDHGFDCIGPSRARPCRGTDPSPAAERTDRCRRPHRLRLAGAAPGSGPAGPQPLPPALTSGASRETSRNPTP